MAYRRRAALLALIGLLLFWYPLAGAQGAAPQALAGSHRSQKAMTFPTSIYLTIQARKSATPLPTRTPRPTATPTDTRTPTPTRTPTATPTATLPSTIATPTSKQVSSDPLPGTAQGQHASEVEPDTFAYNGVVVGAFQVGRIYNGGSAAIGWATERGGTWTNGLLPSLTVASSPAGPYDRATDPSVAYDAAHHVWLISALDMQSSSGVGVSINRSPDGVTWSGPSMVATGGDLDKDWIVCDDSATSPYYGHCYDEWDDNGNSDYVYMATSTDGGLTWSRPGAPAGGLYGLGGQPLVQPNGTVIVPLASAYENQILSFRSTNGGASWERPVLVGTSPSVGAGQLRTSPLPSAEIDAAGRVYVVWQDCGFEAGCAADDIVLAMSSDGLTWSAPARIPTDRVGSGVTHVIPGIGVDHSTSGSGAHLALTYYAAPAGCSVCQLTVYGLTSLNGGVTWSAPRVLSTSMSTSWLPRTSEGLMVGDYLSTSIDGGTAYAIFAVAHPPVGGRLDESMYASAIPVSGGTAVAVSGGPARRTAAVQTLVRGKSVKMAH